MHPRIKVYYNIWCIYHRSLSKRKNYTHWYCYYRFQARPAKWLMMIVPVKPSSCFRHIITLWERAYTYIITYIILISSAHGHVFLHVSFAITVTLVVIFIFRRHDHETLPNRNGFAVVRRLGGPCFSWLDWWYIQIARRASEYATSSALSRKTCRHTRPRWSRSVFA